MDLAFAFPVTTTKDGFVPSKIQKKTVLSLSWVSCFPRLSLLVWIILHFVDILSIFLCKKLMFWES